MGIEQKLQQFYMPDKGAGRPGRNAREERELEQAIQVFRDKTPLDILSTEPKMSPSSFPTVKETQEQKRKKPRLGKKEAKELKQAIEAFKHGRPLEILSTEPKMSPSTRARGTQPHSEEIKQVLKDIEDE
jgi:hypothetical protein